MRRILVDAARKRQARKRGQRPVLVNLDSVSIGVDLREDLVALDDALARLAAVAPLPARVVELRYFGGLSVADIAASLDVPRPLPHGCARPRLALPLTEAAGPGWLIPLLHAFRP